MARWNHTDPFPNSEVKRCCGHDSLGVALRHNSSMPGLYYIQKPPLFDNRDEAFVFESVAMI
jgi:hypothetical protein